MANFKNPVFRFGRGLFSTLRYASCLGVFFLLLIAAERPARAYTDPGTGTMLFQLLAAAFFGAWFYVRKIIQRLKGKD